MVSGWLCYIRKGRCDGNRSSARCIVIVMTDKKFQSKDAVRDGNKTVGAMHACRMMGWSSLPLVCRGSHKSGPRVTDISLTIVPTPPHSKNITA
ncbi:hypothetical protein TNCV_5082951 [Trichonephila clavipes]|nr:hypothetical protein TNCV_5082951 [Trichonephila clavipes]